MENGKSFNSLIENAIDLDLLVKHRRGLVRMHGMERNGNARA